jgi:hypothetical protein
MHRIIGLIAILAFLPFSLGAGEKKAKTEFAEFSRLAHAVAVKQLPKQIEENSAWGPMTEIPDNLPLMAVRKFVKVGDHLEAPHGSWRRFKGRIEDPDKNLKINVKDFKQIDAANYRVVVDVDAIVTGQVEFQQWQKGLLLFGADATIDANLTAALVIDVKASLNFKKLPPELEIVPKVSELGLNLVDFKLRNGPLLNGQKGKLLTSQFKDFVRAGVKASEPLVKDLANQAIVQSLKEGRGPISADAIMKGLPKK